MFTLYANTWNETLHDCETIQIDVCCMCVNVIRLMDVVRHLSDGKMFNVKMGEIDSGGRFGDTRSPNMQCYIDQDINNSAVQNTSIRSKSCMLQCDC